MNASDPQRERTATVRPLNSGRLFMGVHNVVNVVSKFVYVQWSEPGIPSGNQHSY